MDTDTDCVFCTPEQFFDPPACVGQLQLPWSKSDKKLLVADHKQALERYYGEGNVTVVEID